MPAKKQQQAVISHNAHALRSLISNEITLTVSYMGGLLSGESTAVENQELFSSFMLVKGLE